MSAHLCRLFGRDDSLVMLHSTFGFRIQHVWDGQLDTHKKRHSHHTFEYGDFYLFRTLFCCHSLFDRVFYLQHASLIHLTNHISCQECSSATHFENQITPIKMKTSLYTFIRHLNRPKCVHRIDVLHLCFFFAQVSANKNQFQMQTIPERYTQI